MNQNQIGRTVFDIDEESHAFYFQKAIEYHEWLLQQEAQPRLTRTPIFRDREDAERRLRADYFDDHCKGRMSISSLMKCTAAIRQFAYSSTANAFDEYLQMTGANNDINVLDNSPLFDDILDDLAPTVPYVVNGVEYHNGYYLADGIYPEWASFVKSFTVATDPKHTYFKQRQESARKDVERAFGVLQGRWGLIQQPARIYEVNTLRRIIKQPVPWWGQHHARDDCSHGELVTHARLAMFALAASVVPHEEQKRKQEMQYNIINRMRSTKEHLEAEENVVENDLVQITFRHVLFGFPLFFVKAHSTC
nr:hypothetical protein [Tanacetum cinerariifolium]